MLEPTANDGAESTSDTVNVTVKAAPVLTTLTVTPSSVTLAPNATQQFSASGLDQYGAAIPTTPTWTATGGSIDTNGLYQAGNAEGTFSVTATDGTINDSASVDVQVPAGAPRFSDLVPADRSTVAERCASRAP